MRALIACLFMLSIQAHAQTDDLLARIAAQLDKHAVVRSEFTQTKQINGLKRPLQTSGQLVFSHQAGALWQIEQPYRVTYILGADKLVEIGTDGSRKERLARDLPGLSQVGRVFRAMLGANTAALHEYFDIQAQGDTSNWLLKLTPRQAQMAQFIVAMEISGGAYVVTIRIQESAGDLTQIKLRNSSTTTALTDKEQQLFSGGTQP